MSVKLLTEHHLVFLNLKGGCTGGFESTLVKMPHCWKSRVAAHMTTGVNPDQEQSDQGFHNLHTPICLNI